MSRSSKHNLHLKYGVQFGNIYLHFVKINVLSVMKYWDNYVMSCVNIRVENIWYVVAHSMVSQTRTYLFFIPDNGYIWFHHLQKGLTLYFYQWGFSYIMWHSRPRIYIPWEISSLLFWIYFVRGIIIMVLGWELLEAYSSLI